MQSTVLKRVAAIHDISCLGKCSLTVALPIISAAGVEVSVIPTAVLSTPTGGFENFTYRDLTEDMLPVAEHWTTTGADFDAFYTGFLGSAEQTEIVSRIFDKLKKDNKIAKVGDSNYFEYIRSLSSVHPGKTDRHKEFQFANFEVSPYVVWNGGIYALDPRCNGEIILVTYNNETDQMLINKSIYIKEIFNFIKYKYYSINYLTKYVKKYYLYEIKTLRDTPIRKRNDLKNNLEYLNNLVNESKKRCPNITDEIQEVIDIFNQQITREENINKYNKYCNALLYSMKGIHRQLQNMDFKCESPIDNLLFKLLVGEIHLKNNAKMNYSYPLQKILDLKLESGDKEFALIQYKTLLPFFNKYIKVTEEDLYQLSYEELYVLSQIAIYLHELEYDDIVNFCIPNDEEFR